MRNPPLRPLLALLLAGCGGDPGSGDDAGTPDLLVADLAPAPACEGDNPMGAAFDDGPGGTTPRTLAADFTVPTLDGDFTFKARWTGCDSYLFIPYASANMYSKQLWNSSLDDLFAGVPKNVHLFFASYSSTTAMADVAEMKTRVDAALASLPAADQDHWKSRVHYVTAGVRTLPGWIPTLLGKNQLAFGIDRAQRIREVGLLSPVTGQQNPLELAFLSYEARYYNFEWAREQKLHTAKTPTILHVFDGTKMDEVAVVDFPDAKTMAGFDTMELDLGMWCKDHLESTCAQWDYIQDLVLCDILDVPDGGTAPGCATGTILGRFITTYHREGRWVVDVSPLLALLKDGGRRALHYNSQYFNQLDIRLYNSGKGGHPSSVTPLWNGEFAFDKDYNTRFQPKQVPIPAGATRVQLFAFISGHGFGADVENCAEFCDHEHRFTVNGTEFLKDFPIAGSSDGCIDQIEVGTVPNQYGTWPFGRGGWCPGLEVKPYLADVTDKITPGQTATLSYRGTFMGDDYVPIPANNGGFGALMRLQSWLVVWTQ